jgi:2-polyprenyl-6-hydroxyphenyl methylase/3-demethylubiquinone-9 3-methyltransferase
MKQATIDPSEIAHFAKDSSDWWNESGAFAPLHRLNPVRIAYIRDQMLAKFGTLKGLEILDIGCGGGLVAEPLTRLGAKVTAIDGDAQAVQVAKQHALENYLKINYLTGDASILLKDKKRFDVVLGLEIIEHVTDPLSFIETVTALSKPSGMVILSTLNRTPKSYALGIIAAEYILGWVPKGTHSWQKFLKPSELSKMLHRHNFIPSDVTGLVYNPLRSEFSLSSNDVAVNYFLTASKQA